MLELPPSGVALLGTAFASVPFGIALFDRDSRLVLANAMYRELLELPESALPLGSHVNQMHEVLTTRGEFVGYRNNDLARQRIQSMQHGEPFSVERARPNGRWIKLQHLPLPGSGFVLLYSDITDRIEHRWRSEGVLLDLRTRVRELEEQLARAAK